MGRRRGWVICDRLGSCQSTGRKVYPGSHAGTSRVVQARLAPEADLAGIRWTRDGCIVFKSGRAGLGKSAPIDLSLVVNATRVNAGV